MIRTEIAFAVTKSATCIRLASPMRAKYFDSGVKIVVILSPLATFGEFKLCLPSLQEFPADIE